jgi:hypothetical protein
VINQIRAFLLERGLVFAQTPAKLKAAMTEVLENADADLTPMMRNPRRTRARPSPGNQPKARCPHSCQRSGA